jgi:hypothetical protein
LGLWILQFHFRKPLLYPLSYRGIILKYIENIRNSQEDFRTMEKHDRKGLICLNHENHEGHEDSPRVARIDTKINQQRTKGKRTNDHGQKLLLSAFGNWREDRRADERSEGISV